MPEPTPIANRIDRTALAFRGYNTENLGRTAELLYVPRYREIVCERLTQASDVCSEVTGRSIDLIRHVERGEEAPLERYAESVALVFATELAQLDLLEQIHGVRVGDARLAFGYSLGELVALVASGVVVGDEVLRVPLTMAPDCAELAGDVTMGILFSRGPAIDERSVHDACEQLTSEGAGVIGVSAVLSPNTYLVLGQQDTVRRLRKRLSEFFPQPVHLKRNDARWPPLHTPIVRQKHVPDRAAVMMQTLSINSSKPNPPVFSMVTGQRIADGSTSESPSLRQTLRDWVDHPQRLWDAVVHTLSSDVATIIHVGPAPNVIPATFRRLSDNIRQQTSGGTLAAWGARAASQAQRTWLSSLLPKRTALLRAPDVEHVVLEDWLIENA